MSDKLAKYSEEISELTEQLEGFQELRTSVLDFISGIPQGYIRNILRF